MKLQALIAFSAIAGLAALAWLVFVSSAGGLQLSRVTFADLEGWNRAGLGRALASFERSCAVLMQRSDATSMGGVGYAGTVGDWRESCTQAHGDGRQFFQQNFTPYRVRSGFFDNGRFTGYYEPKLLARHMREGAFQIPVYGMPADLVRADLGLFLPKLKGAHIAGKLFGTMILPYPTRAEIDARGISNAPVLFFTDDPVALFFLQIQGSGRVVFGDGTVARVGYAGDNGRPYTAIGRTLIQQGALARQDMSMQSIRNWLKTHPSRAQEVMENDQSFVFFHQRPVGDSALGSPGALGAALTPLASLAVDWRIHALGVPFYVALKGADPISDLMVAQDIGGAIRGPVRADLFFGFGANAEGRAGALNAHGRLYLLLPNQLAAKIGRWKSYPKDR